jgi:hypothetical protein
MKRYIKTPIEAAYKQGLVSIWWYTDTGEFWSVSCTLDNAVDSYGYLQVSLTDNHMNLWRKVVYDNADPAEADKIISKGYKSIERGRVVFNVRTQAYEVICSKALVNDAEFRDACIQYFGLSGNRYSFEALSHYGKQELTGNPVLDKLYYEDGQF